ncbi:hypothetical protein DRH13_04600, partial [Candidatus Woesebacteria bacterium]
PLIQRNGVLHLIRWPFLFWVINLDKIPWPGALLAQLNTYPVECRSAALSWRIQLGRSLFNRG